MEQHHFSFFPFGVLYCLTLFSFLIAFSIHRLRFRRKSDAFKDVDQVLKYRLASGELSEAEYLRVKDVVGK